MGSVLVSIDCITFNHEKFIRQALESFLMQKTDFRFEVLVHDDASTDGTQSIIKEYAEKFPDIIKPIYQKENQYSKGVAVEIFNLERAQGKYIAICEGDDYWTDPDKLQKQFDYMEAHPECSMTIHAAAQVSNIKKKLPLLRPAKGNRQFFIEEFIERGGGFFPTNSIMHLREVVAEYPDFYFTTSVGDNPLAIWAALCGEVHYLDEIWSAYRLNVEGSWTSRKFSDMEKRSLHYREIGRMLDQFNEFSGYRYTDSVNRAKRKHSFLILVEQGKYKEVIRDNYLEFYKQLHWNRKVTLHIKHLFPVFAKLFISLKWKLRYK